MCVETLHVLQIVSDSYLKDFAPHMSRVASDPLMCFLIPVSDYNCKENSE